MFFKEKEIFFFSPTYWNCLFQRHQAIAKELASRGYKIYFINPLYTNGYKIDINSNFFDNIDLINIRIPFKSSNYICINYLSMIFVCKLLFDSRILTKSKKTSRILWFAEPSYAQLLLIPKMKNFINFFNANIIYDCCDNHGSFPRQNPQAWKWYENLLMDNVDLLIVSNKKLLEKLQIQNRRRNIKLLCLLLPNASYTKLSSQVYIKRNSPSKSNKFYLLSSGAHYEWCNFDFLYKLTEIPEVVLILAGEGRGRKFKELIFKKNVIFYRKLSIQELYALAGWCDIGLIPFLDLNLTKYVDPIKAYDYKACGLYVWAIGPIELKDHPMVDFYSSDLSNISSEWLLVKERYMEYLSKIKNFDKFLDINNLVPTWNDRVNQLLSILQSLV